MGAIRQTLPSEAADDSGLVLIDVREPVERMAGHIEGSIHIPMNELHETLGAKVPDLNAPLLFYCAVGSRSNLAAAFAIEMGYTGAASMVGGFERWRNEGLAWSNPGDLSKEQAARYARHIALPGIGTKGQSRLLGSRIAVVGAGGLGSPVALYLAAAGVGTIGLVDDDAVDATNLQRQVIHSLDHVGRPKTESARERLSALNPDVKVVLHQERLDSTNAIRILAGYDIIVDATDNFPTRYLINDASLHLRTPVVHASIYRFEGQISVFDPYRGPCYRCMFPLPPPPDLAASCDAGGVLGVLPGVIGTLQATEALKLALGLGEPLVGRLLLYDALSQRMSELHLPRDPECAACADEGSPPLLIDYDAHCRPG